MAAAMAAAATALFAFGAARRAARRADQLDATLERYEAQAEGAAEALNTLLLDGAEGAAIWGGSSLDLAAGAAAPLRDLTDPSDPLTAARMLARGDSADRLAPALDRLFRDGAAFNLMIEGPDGALRRAIGRPLGSRAVLRLVGARDPRRDTMRLAEQLEQEKARADALATTLNQAPVYAWRRDAEGRLTWVNTRYADAVEADSPEEAVTRGVELSNTDQAALMRDLALKALREGAPRIERRSTVIDGARRVLEAREVPVADGTLGYATDVSAQVAAAEALSRQIAVNEQTLDRLRRGVAIFGKDMRLNYYNNAVADVWRMGDDLDWLDGQPTLSEVLNALRDRRRVPQMRDFASWRREMLERFGALHGPYEANWHLTDGGALHVLAQPHPLGGVLCLFEDVSNYFELKRDVATVSMVQRAALESLQEGVLVLGLDGRRRLSNDAFNEMWGLAAEGLENAHIGEIVRQCAPLFDDQAVWNRVISYVSGESEFRRAWSQTLERKNGSVVSLATAPLPDGATMFAFTDITDSFNRQRALRVQNEKLEEISRLKGQFLSSIHNTSRQLNIPLNTILGFSEILGQQMYGELNLRQKEYVDGIYVASNELRRLVSGIIDLAMLQADDISLRVDSIDLRKTLENTVGFIERNAGEPVLIRVACPPDIGHAPGDAPRFREIAHNLLNAVRMDSGVRESIEIGARREGDRVALWVGAEKSPISATVRGALAKDLPAAALPEMTSSALGVTLVRQFVERQGGVVAIEERVGGTREAVVCRFLADADAVRAAISRARSGGGPADPDEAA